MNATDAKELLEVIPANEFIVGDFGDDIGKCCAIGHLVRLKSKHPSNYHPDNCTDRDNQEVYEFARDTVEAFLDKVHNTWDDLASVNNHPCVNGYTQKKVKTRVINLLKDMIKAGY